MDRKISVAIPHYNNSNYITDALFPLIHDDRIDEIIICDDNSSDYDILNNIINNLNCNKIKLVKNIENIGCYHNKIKTVGFCTNEWTLLLDSDNIMDKKFIDTLYEISHWDDGLIYAPSWAMTDKVNYAPNLDYRIYSNVKITPDIYLNEFNNCVFQCLINTCNYFLPVKQYTECMKTLQLSYKREVIDCLDSAVLFTDWLCFNKNIFIVEDLTYFHRLHNNSNYVLSPSKNYCNYVNQMMIDKIIRITTNR